MTPGISEFDPQPVWSRGDGTRLRTFQDDHNDTIAPVVNEAKS